jgi:hypothetical protein
MQVCVFFLFFFNSFLKKKNGFFIFCSATVHRLGFYVHVSCSNSAVIIPAISTFNSNGLGKNVWRGQPLSCRVFLL